MRQTLITRSSAAVVAALGQCCAAQAQSTTSSTVMFSLSWTESDSNGNPAGNGNGILEPGENALIHLRVSFTNQNTVGTYSPFPPGNGSGTIRGLGSGIIDLHGSATNGGDARGVWNVDATTFYNLGTSPNWDLLGTPAGWGTPANGGADLRDLQFGQFPGSVNSINTTNPIVDIWKGVWAPNSFAPRSVTFQSVAGTSSFGLPASVLFKTTGGLVSATCPAILGSVQIPIVPAPATSLVLVPLLCLRSRSRARS